MLPSHRKPGFSASRPSDARQRFSGGRFEVLPPAGMFTPADLYTDFLLWVGGSGITPVMSVLKSALCAGLILACQARPITDEVRIQF
jgi:hypothetical protein